MNIMLKGEFKPVMRSGYIIGFIHKRFDGAFEATCVDSRRQTITDSFDLEGQARNYIKNNSRRKI